MYQCIKIYAQRYVCIFYAVLCTDVPEDDITLNGHTHVWGQYTSCAQRQLHLCVPGVKSVCARPGPPCAIYIIRI